MNWKNVAYLIRVDRKSGRLLRGKKLTKYRENRFFAYWVYWVALALGLAIGLAVGFVSNYILAADQSLKAPFQQWTLSFFFSLPTLVLIYSLVFTMMQQIQRGGVKFSSQVPYWLPITWQEHTLASILGSLLGFPLISIIFISSFIAVFSIFIGQVLAAVMTLLAICAAAFMASAVTEVFRIFQVRFIGAVYKSTGRAAVWVRFIGSLILFLAFYIVYFYVTSGAGTITFIETVASAQNSVWFVPFVWLGMTLYYLTSGSLLQGLAFLIFSSLFIVGLFFLATSLNKRFGLYEPPAITVSRGVYAPRTGLLGKLGFSTVEAALIRKDFKAFTRRRELMTIFIVPIVIVFVLLMQSMGATANPAPTFLSGYFSALTLIMPASIMAMSLGNLIIGEEGQAIWRIYSSPISANSIVKSKYFFIIFFSVAILAITGVFGFVFYHPSLQAVLVAFFEAVFLVFALGSISLSNGIKGADFAEAPRARMIRLSWSIINFFACLLATAAILIPFLPYMLSAFVPNLIGFSVDLYQAVIVSAIITIALTIIFYRIALKNAKELLAKAEI